MNLAAIIITAAAAGLAGVYALAVLANIERRRELGQSWLRATSWALVWPVTYWRTG